MALLKHFAGLRSALLKQQLDDRQRARLLSAGGQQAGAWLCIFPVSVWSTVRARHYQLALCMSLGSCVIPELQALLGRAELKISIKNSKISDVGGLGRPF